MTFKKPVVAFMYALLSRRPYQNREKMKIIRVLDAKICAPSCQLPPPLSFILQWRSKTTPSNVYNQDNRITATPHQISSSASV